MIRDWVKDYKLRHLKLGKLVHVGKSRDTGTCCLKSPSKDILWQMDRVLAIIIRDYLRAFIRETPAIGNCVIPGDPLRLTESEDKKYWRRWCDAANKTADEFDELRRLIEETERTRSEEAQAKIQPLTERAFGDLACIYNDLCW